MNKEINIFDLESIEDIPEKMRNKIQKKDISHRDELLLSLFDLKKEISLDQIMVGLYRKYNVEKSRQSISSILHHLKRKKFILKNKSGNWCKT